MSIAPNSQSGQKLRIKGKGLKGKTGVGDMFAVLKIVMPPVGNDKANTLWQELAETVGFNPRMEWNNK